MPLDILMPALFPGMREGRLAKWRVSEGERIAVGTVIAEIEAGECTVEVAAEEEGVIRDLLVPEGPKPIAVDARIAVLALANELREGAISQSRLAVSPLARRLAKTAGIDIASVKGSGPGGRVIKRDVDAVLAAAAEATPETIAPAKAEPPLPAKSYDLELEGSPPRTGTLVPAVVRPRSTPALTDAVLRHYRKGSYEIIAHDGLRRAIAEAGMRSARTVPHLIVSVDCIVDALLAAIGRINTAAAARSGRDAVTVETADVLVKAMGLALHEVPAANATWTEIGMLRHRSADVAIEVQVEGGYLQPVVRAADLKSLSDIASERAELTAGGIHGRLGLADCEGAVTAITDFTRLGVKRAEAVITPPHASVLSLGAPERRPVVSMGQIVPATVMTCTLAVDARVFDATDAAELLGHIKTFVEDPVRMLA